MKKLTLIIILLSAFSLAKSQGFNWQYSARMPFKSPELFAGITFGYVQGQNSGSFMFLQNYTLCCNFSNGSGAGFLFGAAGQWWIKGDIAIEGELYYHRLSSDFNSEDSIPTRNFLIRRSYLFNSSQSFLGISFGAKKRLFGSHFSVNLGSAIEFQTSSGENNFTYSITAPDSMKSGSQVITNGKIADYNSIMIIPYTGISWDLPVSNGLYGEISLKASTPVNNVIADGDWRRYDIMLGLKIFFGLTLPE